MRNDLVHLAALRSMERFLWMILDAAFLGEGRSPGSLP